MFALCCTASSANGFHVTECSTFQWRLQLHSLACIQQEFAVHVAAADSATLESAEIRMLR